MVPHRISSYKLRREKGYARYNPMTRSTMGCNEGWQCSVNVVFLTSGASRLNRLNAQHRLFSRYVLFRYILTEIHDTAHRLKCAFFLQYSL